MHIRFTGLNIAKVLLAFTFSFTLSSTLLAQNNTIDAVSAKLTIDQNLGDIHLSGDKLTINAHKGSDLFTSADGKSSTDASPRVLFSPKGDFIFSAKISVDFHKPYDGAALLLYGDKLNWGKLLFEKFKSGHYGIATTVSRGFGDDVYHGTRSGESQYLKIVRRGALFVFYSSDNGKDWNMLRNFGFQYSGDIKLGFTAQSPLSESFEAVFSEIQYREKSFEDFWQGE